MLRFKKYFFLLLATMAVGFIQAQPPEGNADAGDVYGQNFKGNKVMKASKITSLPDENEVVGKFEGTVLEICPKKGCWIKLKLDNDEVATVKMKDYGFFVPTALVGKKVRIQGKASLAVTSVKELKHFAEDAQKSEEEIAAITEPKTQVKIMADGIRVIEN